MIVYCDTSALVKLYIDEIGSDIMTAQVDRAEIIATSRIAWVEFHATVARRAREAPSDTTGVEAAKRDLSADWPNYLKMSVDQNLVEKAGEFADAFALRGYDAVHLAAAHRAMEQATEAVTFTCFDTRLNRAAGLLGMTVLDSA